MWEHRRTGTFCIWQPKADDQFRNGRTLLWLFYALLGHLDHVSSEREFSLIPRGSTSGTREIVTELERTLPDFVRAIEKKYPLVFVEDVSRAESL